MTGYRLGYAIGPKDLIQAMTRLQENVVACAPLPSQHAAIAAYSQEINTCEMLHEFTLRRQVILEGVRGIPNVSLSGIDGTFYAFVNIEKTGLNSLDFASRLLECRHVAVVPGRTYGEEYDSYIRIAFTVNCRRLMEAMSRIKTFVLEEL